MITAARGERHVGKGGQSRKPLSLVNFRQLVQELGILVEDSRAVLEKWESTDESDLSVYHVKPTGEGIKAGRRLLREISDRLEERRGDVLDQILRGDAEADGVA